MPPRVYAIAGVADSKEFQLQLGLLSLGEQSWVSYEASASLHALDRSDSEAVGFTIERKGHVSTLAHRVHTRARVVTRASDLAVG